jgi:hypothetical protein
MLRTIFTMLWRAFPMLRTGVLATFNEGCCDQCCEFVCGMLRAAGCEHPTSGVFLPSSPSCCDYNATMLRPVFACNIQHQEPSPPPPRHKPNIKCLQHRNSTFATLKFNVYNIQHQGWHSFHSTQHPTSHVCDIETQHPQHRNSTSATSKINICNIKKIRSNFETFTWNTRNTARTWMQHIRNDCNMNDKRLHHECDQLQHAKNIIATPIYNCCNIKKAVATSPVRARGGCRSFPAHATMTADDKSSWLRLGTGCTTNGGWGGVTLVRRRGWGLGGRPLALVVGRGHGRRVSSPPVQLRPAVWRGSSSPEQGRRWARSLEPSSGMEGSALACAGLGDEGGEPTEWSSRITIMARGGGAGERPDHG